MITHLSSFRGESRFSTWAWRVAVRVVLEHGQALGAVRTDVDTELLVQSTVGMLFAADAWRHTQTDLSPEDGADQVLSLLQRLVAP